MRTQGPATPTTDLARAENDLFEHGYCVVTGALAPAQVTALRARLEEQARAEREAGIAYEFGGLSRATGGENFVELARPGDDGPKHQFVGVLINKGRVFRDLVLHPAPAQLAAALLGKDWVLSFLDSSIVRPGGPLQALHTDQWWMPRPEPRGRRQRPPGDIRRGEYYGEGDDDPQRTIAPAVSCTGIFTLSDFRPETGATVLVPGSHLSGEQPDPKQDYGNRAVAVSAPAGSLILWDARTWHGMGSNRSGEERVGLYIGYNAPMFRTQINFQVALLPEVKAEASPELLARLGFKVWGGYYGRVGAGDGDLARPEDVIGELR